MEKNKLAYIIGYNIKVQLAVSSRSVKWLAENAGIDSSQLRKYLTGYLLMGVDKLVKISDALKCSPADLLRGTAKNDIDNMYDSLMLEDN